MKRFILLLLLVACSVPDIDYQPLIDGPLQIDEVAVSDGTDLVGDPGLKFTVQQTYCGATPCNQPRLAIGGLSPQAPLSIQSDPLNGMHQFWNSPVGSWFWSVNGATINATYASAPLEPHFNLGPYVRGMRITEAPSAQGGDQKAHPMLMALGWQDGRTAELLSLRRAPNQTGFLLRGYSADISIYGQETFGSQVTLFAITKEGALYLGTVEPATPPAGLVAFWACGADLCSKDSSGTITPH